MPNPAIPGTLRDRTGSQAIQRRAAAEIKRRYAGLQTDVLELFNRIPVYALNDDYGAVVYGMTPDQYERLSIELAAALDRWVAGARDPAHIFWYDGMVSDASQMGAAQSVANLSALAPAYAASRALETVIYSAPYQNRLAVAQMKSYEHWTGLAAAQKAELTQVIGRAVIDGKNPKAVTTEIMERMDVGRAKALAWAQTDITDTLRKARMAEADYTSENLGIKIGLLWTSALIPTTRAHHAARNGKVFDSAEVKAFYSVNGNRYNCRCAVTEALLDENGKPILSARLKASMLAERETWEKQQAATS